mmetsp:Transcript_35080/g.51378  ORF Transcript_35080/g.51378 Transcript_35080/m.51378 type:complete len:130 (+) Transcript_35080:354-743(+)
MNPDMHHTVNTVAQTSSTGKQDPYDTAVPVERGEPTLRNQISEDFQRTSSNDSSYSIMSSFSRRGSSAKVYDAPTHTSSLYRIKIDDPSTGFPHLEEIFNEVQVRNAVSCYVTRPWGPAACRTQCCVCF